MTMSLEATRAEVQVGYSVILKAGPVIIPKHLNRTGAFHELAPGGSPFVTLIAAMASCASTFCRTPTGIMPSL